MPTFGFDFALVRAGGQLLAHAPEQRLLFFRSCPKAYSVRPCASTITRPRLVLRRASAWPWAAAVAVEDGAAAAAVALPDEPQPARAATTTGAARGGRSEDRFMRGYTARPAQGFGSAATLRCRSCARASVDGDQVHHEHERLVGADHPAGVALAVRELRRDRDAAPAAHLHPRHALVPARDHLPLAEPELERVTRAGRPGSPRPASRRPAAPSVPQAGRTCRAGACRGTGTA